MPQTIENSYRFHSLSSTIDPGRPIDPEDGEIKIVIASSFFHYNYPLEFGNPRALLTLQGDCELKTTKSSPDNIYQKTIFVHLATYKHE